MPSLSMFQGTRPGNAVSSTTSANPLDVAGCLLSDTAHDLRNPLAAARELVQLVADGVEGPVNEAQHQHLLSVVRRCDDMQRLIDDMLHYDSARNGCPRIQKAWHRLSDLPAAIGSLVAPTLSKRSIQLDWIGFEDELPRAYADLNMLRRLMVNLVDNAARQTPENGQISIRTQIARSGDRIRIRVEDTGAGIAPGKIGMLASRGVSRQQGHGLGLAICRQIAAAHFTQISVSSEVDKGTAFSIELPVGGPKAVVDMFACWRASIATAATTDPGKPKRQRARRRNVHAQTQSIDLPMEAAEPKLLQSISMVSAHVDSAITGDASNMLDRFLQGQGAMHELIYRVEQDQWIMLLDNNLAQAEHRIMEIEESRSRQSESEITDASLAWQGPIAMPVGNESHCARLQEAFLRGSLGITADDPQHDLAQMSPPLFSEVAQKRLDAEVKWITDKFRKRQIIMHRQAESLRPKMAK